MARVSKSTGRCYPWPCLEGRLAERTLDGEARQIEEEPVIYREEVTGLLFTAADISDTLDKLLRLLKGEDEEEADE
jgi:hypothetical protein